MHSILGLLGGVLLGGRLWSTTFLPWRGSRPQVLPTAEGLGPWWVLGGSQMDALK